MGGSPRTTLHYAQELKLSSVIQEVSQSATDFVNRNPQLEKVK